MCSVEVCVYLCRAADAMLTRVFLSGMQSAVPHRAGIHLSILVLLYLRSGTGQLQVPMDLISKFYVLHSKSFLVQLNQMPVMTVSQGT